jgi:hypothetical protein
MEIDEAPVGKKDNALRLGINHDVSGVAFITFDDVCRGGITHTFQRTGELGVVSSIVILEANVEMPSSI